MLGLKHPFYTTIPLTIIPNSMDMQFNLHPRAKDITHYHLCKVQFASRSIFLQMDNDLSICRTFLGC